MWICKQFNVLPSNPDFQNLTPEQRSLLWEDYLLDNPKIKQRIEDSSTNKDEEFEEMWESESVEFTDITEDVNIDNFERNFQKMDSIERDTIEYPAHARRVFDMIEKHKKEQERIQHFNNADWEEGEITDIDISDFMNDSDDFFEV